MTDKSYNQVEWNYQFGAVPVGHDDRAHRQMYFCIKKKSTRKSDVKLSLMTRGVMEKTLKQK